MKEFLNFAKSLIALILVLWLLFTFCIGIIMAPNDDMKPRIDAGDLVVFYRINLVVNINDVVVVKKNGTQYVLRAVALPGDTVEITKERNLLVNGNMIVNPDIFYPTPMYEGFVEYPLKLGPDEYFLLADKRDGGEDSRYFGVVKKDEIKGSVVSLLRRGGF